MAIAMLRLFVGKLALVIKTPLGYAHSGRGGIKANSTTPVPA